MAQFRRFGFPKRLKSKLGESVVFHGPGDLDRKISLYEGLIEEYSQQEEPDEWFLVRLLNLV